MTLVLSPPVFLGPRRAQGFGPHAVETQRLPSGAPGRAQDIAVLRRIVPTGQSWSGQGMCSKKSLECFIMGYAKEHTQKKQTSK